MLNFTGVIKINMLAKKKKKNPTISEIKLGVQSLQGDSNYGT